MKSNCFNFFGYVFYVAWQAKRKRQEEMERQKQEEHQRKQQVYNYFLRKLQTKQIVISVELSL